MHKRVCILFFLFALCVGTLCVHMLTVLEQKGRESAGQNTKRVVVGILLIVLVVLMICVFSTLDNAVTLVHATGAVDIGQWPRILLALSGLAAAYASQRKTSWKNHL